MWDLATGTPIGSPLTGHSGAVNAVAAAELDGRPVVISGSSDGTVRVWDLATGTPIGSPLTGHTGSVYAVAAAELDGRPVVISGSSDRTVRVVGPGHRHPHRQPAHRPWRSGTVGRGSRAGRPPGGDLRRSTTGRCGSWDLATGTPIGSPLTGHGDWVRSVAARAADSAERRGTAFQFAAAIGNVTVACLAPTLDDDAWWFEDVVALETSSNILALAWSDQRALAAATELGIVVVDLRR